jgi:hypothetical protein
MMGGWGEERRAPLDTTAGNTGAVEAARNALRTVGIDGPTLADQAIAAAEVLGRPSVAATIARLPGATIP